MRALPAGLVCSVCLLAGPRHVQGVPVPQTETPPASNKSAPVPAAKSATPDVYYLLDGDRISGRTLGRGKRGFAVQTPYGRLNLPRAKLARVRFADGREEHFNETHAAPAPPPTAELHLLLGGASFWQAWDPKEAPPDPALRLALTLDGQSVAAYIDRQLDPRDLPGATVNTFVFEPAQVAVSAAPGVRAALPDTRPGRIALRLVLPLPDAHPGTDTAPAGTPAEPEPPDPRPLTRHLRLAYQSNAGTQAEPAWHDLLSADAQITLASAAPAVVELRQDSGRMEFSGGRPKRMKHVDSFRLNVVRVTAPVPPPSSVTPPEN